MYKWAKKQFGSFYEVLGGGGVLGIPFGHRGLGVKQWVKPFQFLDDPGVVLCLNVLKTKTTQTNHILSNFINVSKNHSTVCKT
jgi:hypothetical protein